MKTTFDAQLVTNYKSQSQKARVLTEQWVDESVFCPNCGHLNINKYPNNQPAADFFCSNCKEDYELKSQQNEIGTKIVDGAYRTMIERLQSSSNPNLFLLNYDLHSLSVINFFVVPKHFFVPEIIEKRRPLAKTARRAGWIGCNILLHNIPQIGKIFFIKNKQIETKEKVLAEWRKTLFLREEKEISTKCWLLDIIRSIENLKKPNFSLDDIYAFEEELSKSHPQNKHIKDKIRQQLQILRDRGYLEFLGPGRYRII
ncbi:MAG: restriction endonuclease [Candidatus Taylorbacteria bacterium RIFCSPHIGHO2_02_FULL_47_18]|uniref:Restriction endonuclease n=1 Tax=Candidatus Taylorbacteria bacterium RIFCSPLOWO2_01_FULL_48_100 TaxID=1802322 RepID=A0A1G2NFE0_9BACT|nr:MAG: restriction endonuclease [Candidatus Taylorbacteria bacterium RIFCSPHIGHO2_01_FULL_48_38]OHA27842.1 MAG: restriction endonuclease [Candidatus Taylorbacteria bacterium RIFCSPHIGHO2_02_FULL_47_18]OHA34776.1 MAG: restriction endonuclease [Candidatus Taylorbacteria bacterium RIFCSPLOWO2_01_FULL_48_100]OHA40928.1 MAG: restriction endonuclease [Candidatus Taylorbacteria bacterium RIFCSPLOWO2_02_FULL_48_16]OHA45061.1 MAG: restriction endonuclease [Candidatus Taylorbacteria bacterium RIFCSPLOWO